MVKFWKILAIAVFILGTVGCIISGEYIDGLIAVFLSGMVCLSVSAAFDALYSIRENLQHLAERKPESNRKQEVNSAPAASNAPYYQKFHSSKWTCKDCGYENDNVNQYCKQCGEYK